MTRLTALTLASIALLTACSEPRSRGARDDDDEDDEETTTATGGGGFGGESPQGGVGGASAAGGAGGEGGADTIYPCTPVASVCTQVSSDCIAIADNKGVASYGLRIGQLAFTSPQVFTTGIVGNIIKTSVMMNLPECNLTGDGTLSWLLYFSPSMGQLLTGAARPATDPTAGYCFVSEQVGAYTVAPVQAPTTVQMNGDFSAKVPGTMLIPMYISADASSYVLLPIHEVALAGTLSTDRNCIGQYNDELLKPEYNCMPESGTYAFSDGGTLSGYITLEEADTIVIDSFNQTLCVLLSGNASVYGSGSSPTMCKRDASGTILYKGDWCSETNNASCTDSVRLDAGFAASGVKMTGLCP